MHMARGLHQVKKFIYLFVRNFKGIVLCSNGNALGVSILTRAAVY
jgi:hypothetical protein